MVTRAWKEKDEKELEMKLEWLKDNGYDEVDILPLYLLAVPLSRMTPLMRCLCLNIMNLKITSSATTTRT